MSKMSLNFVRFKQISISNRCRKFQLSILKNKKILILRQIFFWPQSLNMPREIQTMAFAVLIFSEGFATIYLLCPMHASSRRPTVYITEAFQPSQNIMESQSSYMGFLSIQISFYALLCIKKQVFMFHVKCTVTWKGSSIWN